MSTQILITGLVVGIIVGGIVFASIHYGRPEEIILPLSGLPKYKNVDATHIGIGCGLLTFSFFIGRAFKPGTTA